MAEIIRDLEITSLVHGGRGLGRHNGKAVFVPLTIPGDRVTCRIIKSKKRYVEAELVEVVSPSLSRRQPPCPFFGSCGGCQWQHLPYPEQVHWKEQIFSDLIVRNKIAPGELLKPIAQAPDEWSYRNRVELKCHLSGRQLFVGFYRQGSHVVVDIDECRLVAPPIQKALNLVRNELAGLPCPDRLLSIDIACGDDGETRILLHVHPQGRKQLRLWLQDFAIRHQLHACLSSDRRDAPEVVHGEGDLIVKVDDPEMPLRYGPGGFVQVNSAQNRNMVSNMLERVDLCGTENVLDLFCGMGNFSLPIARRAGRVTGVENSASAIARARLNAAANNISNVDFHAADAASVIAHYQIEDDLDLIILDPPRSGNYLASQELLKLGPKRILYVSCDPATLARDLTPLVTNGYKVVSSQPFDLFPQTWHIESMTLLERL